MQADRTKTTLLALVADFSTDTPLLEWNVMLPILAGVVASIGVIGAIRYFARSRGNAEPSSGNRPDKDPLPVGTANEQRRAFRRKGSSVEVLILDPEPGDRPFEGWVVNRSLGGLCLQVESA